MKGWGGGSGCQQKVNGVVGVAYSWGWQGSRDSGRVRRWEFYWKEPVPAVGRGYLVEGTGERFPRPKGAPVPQGRLGAGEGRRKGPQEGG